MSRILEVNLPKFPECWESCGNCASGDITVDDVLVLPGDTVDCDDTLIVLETGKVALDIPSPHAGRVIALFVAAGDTVTERQLILTLEIDPD
jgi:pyruvate/2-oxoglutarate dehydrogenase complex dihydrolipoamide acyltransferase (E2) component